MLKIKTFNTNMFGVNTYVVYDTDSREAMIVDPGMISESETDVIDSFLKSERLKVVHIVNTHLHLDHIFGNHSAERRWGVKAKAHPADLPLGRQLPEQARMFGIPGSFKPVDSVEPLADGDTIRLGGEDIRVIHTPGHSPGGISLYAPASGWVISGDSLFKSGIGRTDLAGGDYAQLIGSITRGLMSLPPETVVYPGHGPITTIQAEKLTNPYL